VSRLCRADTRIFTNVLFALLCSLMPLLPRRGVPDCVLGWVRLDEVPYMNGFAINMLRLVPDARDQRKNKIEIPAIGVALGRV